MVVVVDDIQEFDLLSQRIHPAASRVEMLAREYPAALVAFDLLAEGDEMLLELPYDERRERLAALVDGEVQLTPVAADVAGAGGWLEGNSEGVVAKEGGAPYLPGERKGMAKIKRVRTADVVVAAFRFGKEPGTVGSLILGLYDEEGDLHVVGHTSGFKAAARSASWWNCSSPTAPTSAARGAQPVEVRRGARLGGPAPRARVRDRVRPHHRAADPSRREVHPLAQGQGPGRLRPRAASGLDPA